MESQAKKIVNPSQAEVKSNNSQVPSERDCGAGDRTGSDSISGSCVLVSSYLVEDMAGKGAEIDPVVLVLVKRGCEEATEGRQIQSQHVRR